MTKTDQEYTEQAIQHLGEVIRPRMTKYIPCIPTPKQQAFLWLDCRDAMYGGALGGGKVVMDGTFVLTPHGFKKAEELKPGDLVNNPDGSVAKIIQVHAKQKYEKWIVRFHDGSSLVTTAGHLWKAWRSGKARKIKNKLTHGESGAEIVTTEILKKWLEKSLEQKENGTQAYSPCIPVCEEQPFNVTYKYLPDIDPYLLGVLLGDGSLRKEGIRITSIDHEHMKEQFGNLELDLHCENDYIFKGETFQNLRSELDKIDLLGRKSHDKFIPRQYKYGSIEKRYAVLQGLMDTDGTVDHRGQLYYTTVSKQLADDFLFVLRSLGGIGTIFEKSPSYHGSDGKKVQGKKAYNIYIKHKNPQKLFRLERKKERAGYGVPDLMFRRITDIAIGGEIEGRCITVSHLNGLYITDDFIVTHNSQALLMAALQYPLSIKTEIPTLDGFKKIEDLKIGDKVFDDRGYPVSVISKSEKQLKNSYKVVFSDGEEITASEDHLWGVHSFQDRMAEGHKKYPRKRELQKKTTKELYETVLTNHKRKKENWSVPPIQPLQLEQKKYCLDPYLLGVWLGDGTKNCGTFAGIDEEIKDNFKSNKFQIKDYSKTHWHVRGFRTVLNKMGLLGHKKIPTEFLFGSYEQRLALVQGLMDTDGTVDRKYGSCRFFNTDPEIYNPMMFLLASLGLAPKIMDQKYTTTTGEKKSGKLICFTSNVFVFRIKRKKDLQILKPTREKIIRKVIPCGEQEVQCITVDNESHLFAVTKKLILTHNCDIPFYNALLIRDTYQNLALPESLMFRAHEWLHGTDAKWNGVDKMWKFPSGATLSFGYLDKPTAHFNYMSAEYQFVGIDEIVSIRKNQANFLFSRMRKKSRDAFVKELRTMSRYSDLNDKEVQRLADVYEKMPLRFRCASNPPLPEQLAKGAWVKRDYVDPATRKDRVFIPANMEDNPHLEKKGYIEGLEKGLDPLTFKQLRDGDWEVQVGDRFFNVSKLEIVPINEFPAERCFDIVAHWDFAATPEPLPGQGANPDYTVGLRMGIADGNLYILDMVRGRWGAGAIPEIVKGAARKWGVSTRHIIEQEPGSSGKIAIEMLINDLVGYSVMGQPSTGKKYVRARPVATWVEQGRVKLIEAEWNQAFIDELLTFSVNEKEYEHDDIVDALSGGFSDLGGLNYEEVGKTFADMGIAGLIKQEEDLF